MSFLDVRNTLTKKLAEYLGCPIVLSDQTEPVEAFPFGFYSVLTPYAPTGEQGNHSHTLNPDGVTVNAVRREQPHATISFTFCSVNRWTRGPDGADAEPYIYGEDEAQRLAEKAQGYFLHVGYDTLSNLGVVVVDVSNATNRTGLIVDEAARRYGFDVRVRYTRIDARTDGTVERVAAYKVKEKE
jgi:hypothetical protein